MQAVLAQLQHSDGFLASQSLVLPASQSVIVVQGMVSALVHQINNLTDVNQTAATKLNNAINNSGYDEEMKAKLVAAVSQKAVFNAQQLASNPRSRPRKDCQLMLNPLGMFKQSAWDYWTKDNVTANQMVMYMAGELNQLGCLHPKDATIKRLIALLAAIKWPQERPHPKACYAMVLDLKLALDQYPPCKCTHLLQYPDDPKDLPEDIKERYYQNDFSTVTQHELVRYEEYINLVVTRGHHKLLKGHSDCAASAAPPTPQPRVADRKPLPEPQESGDTLLGQVLAKLSKIEAQQQSSQIPNAPFKPAFGAAAPSAGGAAAPPFFKKEPACTHATVMKEPEEPEDDGDTDDDAADAKVNSIEQQVLNAGATGAPRRKRKAAAAKPDGKKVKAEQAAAAKPDGKKVKAEKAAAAKPDGKKVKAEAGKRARKSKVMKKPAGRVYEGTKKPPVPADDDAETIHWGGGKIYISPTKKAFRVIPKYGIKSDKPCSWKKTGNRALAWKTALTIIEKANK